MNHLKYKYTVILLLEKEGSSFPHQEEFAALKANHGIQMIPVSLFSNDTEALNQALKIAQGDYLLFLHEGDFLQERLLFELDTIIKSYADAVDVFHFVEANDENGGIVPSLMNLWDTYGLRIDNIAEFAFKFDREIVFSHSSDLEFSLREFLISYIRKKMKVLQVEVGTLVYRKPIHKDFKGYLKCCLQEYGKKVPEKLPYFQQYNLVKDFCETAWESEEETLFYRQLLESIDDDLIIDVIGMGNLSLILWMLKIKHQRVPEILPIPNDGIIRVNDYNIACMSYFAVTLHFLKVEHGKLSIEGNISLPAFWENENQFFIRHNDHMQALTLQDREMDLYVGKVRYESRKVFQVELPMDTEKNEIEFFNSLDGNLYPYGKINAQRFCPVADIIKDQYCYLDGMVLFIQGNKLFCNRCEEEKRLLLEAKFQNSLRSIHSKGALTAIKLRTQFLQHAPHKKKPVWLFMDRVDRADDNGEVMFRYMKGHDDIDSYFIIQDGSQDYKRMEPLGGVVALNSEEHLSLVLQADCILSSQANGLVENPFGEDSEFYRDLYHQPKIVFLQHGITKDDQHTTFNRYNTNFWGFVTSSQLEKQSIVDGKYYYDEKVVWLTGMPRFDKLYNNDRKIVLIMPSWRKGLMSQQWDEDTKSMIWKVVEDFYDSAYVQRYKSLLHNQRLIEKCKKTGYQIAFMPHALMEPYIDNFVDEDSSCVYWDRTKSYRDAFAEGSILVTDYSSVAFDFAFLEKPIIYYQFDRQAFFASHTYTQGYFDYQRDGLGPVVSEEEELIDAIIHYIESGCKVEKLYQERADRVFQYRDQNACKRICQKILEEN